MTEHVERYGPALVGAVTRVFDIVAVIDGAGQVEYMNPFGLEVFGYTLEELAGTSLLDIIHPDDVGRVLTGIDRMLDWDDVDVKPRPALVRIRAKDGTFVRVEANGTLGTDDHGEGSHLVVFARPTIDADLHERFMNLLTTGAPSEKVFELVPEFGSWRQPDMLVAVFALDDDGVPLAFGSPSLVGLGTIDDPAGPWLSATVTGDELFASVDELGEVARRRAVERGITWMRARPVFDSLHRSHALVVMAHEVSSPLPADRSTLEYVWFALDKMASMMELALAWRGQAEELRRAAATDPLTGLANRAGFWSRYQQGSPASAAHTVSVLCIDLDRFKPVNDTHGHGVGDALLVDVADRLRRIVRPGDLVARLGGDEFSVVVHELDDDQVAAIAERIVTELGEPFTVSGQRIEIGASVGVASAPVVGFDAEALLDAADRALYAAKNTGRNQWVRAIPGA